MAEPEEKEVTLVKAVLAYTLMAALLMLPAVTMVTLHYVPMSGTWRALGFTIAFVLSSAYYCLFVELAMKDGEARYEEGKKKGAEEIRAVFEKKIEGVQSALRHDNVVQLPTQSGPSSES